MNEEKSIASKLKEEIFIDKKKGFKSLSETQVNNADSFCEDYKIFLDKSKTERESVITSEQIAVEAGFELFNCDKKYKAGDKIYTKNRNKNIVLAVIGENGCKDGVNLSIAHIDAPRLDLKPNPLYEASDLALLKTHYYGGIKKYQWTAIPLALHGVVVLKDLSVVNICIGENESDPVFTITDLLPHLAKEQAEKPLAKSIAGEDLNILVGSRPFKDDKESELVKLNIMNYLYENYNITEQDFLSAELELVPSFKAKDIGFDRSMVGAYGHDDRVCAYPSLMAILNCKTPKKTAITVLADKEEIGSDGNTGMKSDFTKYFIFDLAKMEGLDGYRVMSKSECLSADVNAAFDPTYASAYEPNNSCYINKGVVITKYTGHGGKYGTSDASAEFMGKIRKMLDDNNILWQAGELGRIDLGGGGTIAKYVANLNMDVVDIGVPILSMHAPYEVASKTDIYMTYLTVKAFFEG